MYSKSIDLNAQLGLHTSGGIWKDEDRSGGLNRTTGILNAQLIQVAEHIGIPTQYNYIGLQ
jgi:hypothetical protein